MTPADSYQALRVEEKKCPMCAELVKVDAVICRFCRHEFKKQEVVLEPVVSEAGEKEGPKKTSISGVLIGVFVAGVLAAAIGAAGILISKSPPATYVQSQSTSTLSTASICARGTNDCADIYGEDLFCPSLSAADDVYAHETNASLLSSEGCLYATNVANLDTRTMLVLNKFDKAVRVMTNLGPLYVVGGRVCDRVDFLHRATCLGY